MAHRFEPSRRRALAFAALLPLAAAFPARAQTPPRPGPQDLCPVCGMLITKYPNWTATIAWRDGHAHHFDGAKDLFKFLFDLAKYAPGHRREDIAAIWVTEFYGLTKIDARKAWFVTGSDVLGPMGHELVPLATREDADEFLRDHKGSRILRFDDVKPDLIAALDAAGKPKP